MKNAPLIEIVAEVRWGEGLSNKPPSFVFGGDDGLYVRLGIALAKSGYDRLERMQPEGVPSQSGTIAYRYRRGDELQNTLYQAGLGVFTANGLPPYNAWKEFEPVIEAGLTALWGAKPFDPEKDSVELILRYVDAFAPSHLDGMTQSKFIEDVVGVNYRQASAISSMADGMGLNSIRFNAIHSAQTGEKLVLEVGQGIKDGESVLVLNTSAFSAQFVPGNVTAVSERFGRLQNVLHDMFFELLGRSPELHGRLVGQ